MPDLHTLTTMFANALTLNKKRQDFKVSRTEKDYQTDLSQELHEHV